MAQEYTECPTCKTKLKSGMFGTIKVLNEASNQKIKEVSGQSYDVYCSKCGPEYYSAAIEKLKRENQELTLWLEKNINLIPIISSPAPANWDYQVLNMVTGQSTTGTGVFSEFTSSFNDLVGKQSGAYNSKLRTGEHLCFSQLRMKALSLGGNAVVSTDIDYSELGFEKGMIMVCMAGTAILLKNTEALGKERADNLAQLIEKNNRLKYLSQIEPDPTLN